MTTPGGHPYGGAQQPQGGHDQNRFNFPSAPSRPVPEQNHYQQYGQPQQPQMPPQPPPRAARQPAPKAHNPLVRPYAMTGGRTRPRYQLAIEALVSTTADPARLQGQLPEHQRICRLCQEIKSVAEISALLSIPLGVARILVADLAEAGLVAREDRGGGRLRRGQDHVRRSRVRDQPAAHRSRHDVRERGHRRPHPHR
ncbi:DUF742 domain-containing protein [Streptomyces lavendulae]|uniref:DUF742 domain-containing protein n=1 Tax=Streptomyces lavendulae TaxID=1914 RepID=UPI00373AE88D